MTLSQDISKEELSANFSKVGLSVPDEVIDLCSAICQRQNIDAATFADTWIAFSITVLSSNVPPSPKKLIVFEKKEFGDSMVSTPKQAKISNAFSRTSQNVKAALSSTPKRTIAEVYDEEALKHICQTSVDIIHTPSASQNGKNPSSMPLSNRLNDGYCSNQVTLSFGLPAKWIPSQEQLDVTSNLNDSNCSLMNNILMNVRNNREDMFCAITDRILQINNLPEPSSFSDLSVENSLFIGKICQQEEGKNFQGTLSVEGFGYDSGLFIELDYSGINNYAFFPGQVIAFRGVSRGSGEIPTIIGTHAYINGRGTCFDPPNIKEPLLIAVAAGPFTSPDTLDFSMLKSVVEHTKQIKPNVLIIVGPLIDFDTKERATAFKKHTCTYEEYYSRILNDTLQPLNGLGIKIVYITSAKDLWTIPVFPTPAEMANVSNCIFLQDPSLLNINGFRIGLTTVDILFYLGQQEVSNCVSNRISRLANHLLDQQSFYPLETGPLDTLNIDYEKLWSDAKLSSVPHVLLLPSRLQHYIKDIGGCIAVNPEKCSKSRKSINVAVIEVRNKEGNEEWSPSTHISAKIVRL